MSVVHLSQFRLMRAKAEGAARNAPASGALRAGSIHGSNVGAITRKQRHLITIMMRRVSFEARQLAGAMREAGLRGDDIDGVIDTIAMVQSQVATMGVAPEKL
jgi:hypothetical protein